MVGFGGVWILTSSVAIGWPLEVPCADIFAGVVAKVFFCWLKKVAVGLIAALDAMKGAVREAILREEVRDEAIVSRYLC